ncbi:hypothetical protein SHIRM173S_03733 [Streptomyces hirsutus]
MSESAGDAYPTHDAPPAGVGPGGRGRVVVGQVPARRDSHAVAESG